MPATPWDREYESHKGVEIRGPLHCQVRLEKQNNFVKDPTAWEVGKGYFSDHAFEAKDS